jgi:hypothetical protein
MPGNPSWISGAMEDAALRILDRMQFPLEEEMEKSRAAG